MNLLYRIGILSPSALYAVIPISGLIIFLIYYLDKQIKKYQESGISIASSPMKAPLFHLFIAILIIISLIRPYNGYDDVLVKERGGDLMFLVDISKSMLASDLQPSRMDAVKRKIIDVIDRTERSGTIGRFGLTVYAGDGYTICPLTSDSAVVKQFAELLSPDLVSSGGSNLTAGIETALERLDPNRLINGSILLLTDGEQGAGGSAARRFSEQTPVNVIGFGTPIGSSITLPNGSTLRDNRGRVVVSKLGENYLKELAEKNGGKYARASIDDSDIKHVLKGFGRGATAEKVIPTTIKVYRELGPMVAAIALVCFSLIRLNVIALLLTCLLFSLIGPSQAIRADTLSIFSPDEAHELYNKGDYAEAEKRYRELLKSDPTNRIAKRGLASTLLKREELSESQRLFHDLAQEEQNGRDFYENTFNEGNVLVAQEKYLEAIDAYNRALDVKPGDVPASHNLKIVRQLLEKKKQTPEPQNNKPEEGSDKPHPPQDASSSRSEDQTSNQTPSTDAKTQNEPQSDSEKFPSSPPSTPTTDQGHDNQSDDSVNSASEHQVNDQTPRIKEAFVSASPRAPESLPQSEPPSRKTTEMAPLPSPTIKDSTELENNVPNEVTAWLESLPDSPLLIRRKQSTNNHNQDW